MADPQIITDADTWERIVGGQHPVDHAGLLDWLRSNAIDPARCPTDSTVSVEDGPDGARVIRYTAYLTDEHGNLYLADPDNPARGAAQEERTAPLLVAPPERWGPAPRGAGGR